MAAKKLTRFEKARIIGARALQLSMGAVPQVDISKLGSIDPIDIAMLELKKNKMPLDVKRRKMCIRDRLYIRLHNRDRKSVV